MLEWHQVEVSESLQVDGVEMHLEALEVPCLLEADPFQDPYTPLDSFRRDPFLAEKNTEGASSSILASVVFDKMGGCKHPP